MKKSFAKALLVVALTITAAVQTMAQQSFAYQAVIRNAEGELVTNQKVGLKFSLLNGGKAYYTETQTTDVNEYGNISVEIGKGIRVGDGKFSDVPWNTLDVTLRVEVDPTGGKNYQLLGETKISPAPYAMYATQGGGGAIANGASKDNGNLFEVTDREGRPVFAVTNDGIVVYVDDTDTDDKARRSGFVVTGRTATKNGDGDLFAVTAEGTQVYVDDSESGNDKARRSGFIVTGRTATKNSDGDLFAVNDEGTHVYVDGQSDDKARRSGFVVTGRTATKDADADIFAVDGTTTTVFVDDSDGDKARRSGFIVTGRTATKEGNIVDINGNRTNLSTSAFTVVEHNSELGTVQSMISVNTSDNGQAQVMVHTDIAMEDEVIEVADAPMQGEYAMAVTDSIWFIPAKAEDYNYDPEFNQLMAIYGEGEYAPAVSVEIGNGNYSITIPSLFFDGEGNPTSNAKKAAVVVFDYPEEEGIYVIRPLEPMTNKTIEFGLMNTDGEFVKITAQINSKDGVPFDVPVGDFDGGKITNAGGGYFGSTINLVAVPDKGKIFAGWQTTITIDIDHDIFEYPSYRREYPLNGLPLIDEEFFGSEGLQLPPVFTDPVFYVSSNRSSRYSHGFSDTSPIKSIDQAVQKIALYVSENLADNNLDWTIKIDTAYGAQTIPESISVVTQTPDQPSTEEEVIIKDIVNSIRLTGKSKNPRIDGSWWYSEGEDKWYYGDGGSDSPTPALSVKTQAPVIIDNLTITRGYARFGGGIFMDEGANVTIADGVNITGNTAIASAVDSACGGGIYVGNGAIVTITNGVTIADNTSSSETEKHAYGGGVYVGRCANVTIANGATIDGNKALASAENNSYGGGIYVGPGACVTIADGTYITDNSALSGKYGYGGGVYVSKNNQDVKGILYMTGGQINGNAATTGGGGIFGTGLVVIGSSAVIGNTDITDARGINDESYANKALSGGGIHSNGDLYIGYKLKDGATEITPDNLEEDDKSNVTIQGNYVYCINDYSITLTDGQGGGVYHRSYSGSGAFKMYKTTVAYNRSVSSRDGSGAGVYCAENTAGDKMFKQCQIVGNYSNKAGAGIGIDEGILTIDNTLIYNNSLDGSGQCIGGAGVAVTSNGKLSMENSEIYDNDASYAFTGGGVKVAGGFFYANNCKFYGNHASSGAGLNVNGGKAVLNGTTIVGDKDAHQAPSSGSINGFKGNYSESVNELGAGISVDYYGKLYIGYKMNNFVVGEPDGKSNVKIIGNYSAGKGGGISINGENALVAMHNATVMHNSANGKGNGVYHLNGPFSVSGNTTFDEDNDVYLDNEKVVTVGALDESAAVNITIETIRVGTQVLEPANDGIELANYVKRFKINGLPDGFLINDNGVIVVDEINVGEGRYFESIAAAIEAINAMGDDTKTYTINIVSDLLDEPQIIECSTKIAEEIIIEGNSHKIDLGWDGRLTDYLTLIEEQDDLGTALTIATNVPVTIQNLVITGGCKRNGYGGGIFIGGEYYDGGVEQHLYAANVTLSEGVIVKQNYCSYGGGVAVSAGSTLTIESDAEISNNTSDYGGGGIYAESNGETNYVTVVMEGGTIKQNKCRSDSEGKLGGAGVLIYGAAAKFKMDNGSITENVSLDYGGGVGVLEGAKFEMNDGSITKNKAETENNPDDSHGGGVFVMNSEFTFNGGTISNNTAIYGSGVCVFYNGDPTFTMSGSAKVDADNDVYLDDEKITIDKQLTYAGIVATITLNDYDEDVVVLQRKDGALSADDIAHFAVTPYDTGNGIKYYRVSEEGKPQEIMGSKLVPDAVGDIVFTDGSAMPYSEELTLSDNQKSAAVAVIFDTQNKKGVALQQTNNDQRVQWCIDNKVKGYGFVDGAVSTTDGKANTEAIYALDDFGDGTNYPPFKYAREYSAGGYTDWYIPATDELNSIWNNITVINAALEKVGATIISSSNATPARGYWSSTQVTGNGNNGSAYGKHFFYPNGTGSAISAESKASSDAKLQVRCVRIFDKEFIGAKKPGSELGVGDIVFSDGSATAYVEGLTLDEKQKAAAVAVIFYVGTENDALGKRTLGIGKYNSTSDGNNTTYAWAVDGAMGIDASKMNDSFTDILSYLVSEEPASGQYASINGEYLTGDLDGSDNWGKVKEIDKNYMGKYPGFEWVDEYANSYNLPDDYKDGWFMPSAAELYTLWMNMFGYDNNKLINTILTAIGGTTLKDQDDDYVYSYLTSNRTYENEDGYEYISLTIGFDEGATCSQGLYTVTGYVCAIREF